MDARKLACVIAVTTAAVLSACSGEPAALTTAEPSATTLAQTPEIPTRAPTSSLIPTQTETAEPSQTQPSPTSAPRAPTATSEPPTATSTLAPAATASPAPTAPQSSGLIYIFPVQGASVEYSQFHHDYPAADIFCPVGSLFVAPTSGVIDSVSREDLWQAATNRPEHRGGLAVALIGDDGLRYYGSHLSEVAAGIEPGVRVEAGQELGRTGASGNAVSTPPHLHFGISRPTTPDDWQTRRGEIPPYTYLQAWARGEMLAPVLP